MSPSASAQQDYPNTVNPDCDSTCGDVTITYPFGMRNPTCYADKWFEIECRNTSQGSKPYIKSINLEVTSMDPGSSNVYIMNPVFQWNCNNKTKDSKPVVNLTGTPFVYSKELNKFTTIGCNKIAFLQSNGSKVSGCVSLCDEYDDREVNSNVAYGSDGCVGRFCCETSLPSYLVEFNVTLEELTSGGGGGGGGGRCSQALIGTVDWNRVYPETGGEEYRSFRDLDVDYVRAVLSWVVFNSSAAMKTLPVGNNCTMAANSPYRGSGWVCDCYTGYYGNPYIGGGCIGMILHPFPFVTH